MDSREHAFATNASMKFPKQVTGDLQKPYTVNTIRVYNSSFGGTKTVVVQVSADGETFRYVGTTEFKNYDTAEYAVENLGAKGTRFIRLVFPGVHPISFQHKKNGFIFLRELEVQGTSE